MLHQDVTQEAEAIDIYQAALDDLSRAIMEGDDEAILRNTQLPMALHTQNGDMLIETEKDLIEGFRTFATSLKAQGVNHYIRLANNAKRISDTYIVGRHMTHIMNNGRAVVPPYESEVTLRRTNDGWKVAEQNVALLNDRWPIHYADVARNMTCLRTVSTAGVEDMRSSNLSALSIYQEFIDRLSEIDMSGDFDRWTQMHVFPHTTHTNSGDYTRRSVEDTRPFADKLAALLKETGTDTLSRKASLAEFIAPDKICGYHLGTFLSQGKVVLGPVQSRMVLQRDSTTWRILSVTNGVEGVQEEGDIKIHKRLVTMNEIQKRTRRVIQDLHSAKD
ncbi:hypothetical protein IV417_14465 [Alphaproteobacteria bacterium KMM 3653]|uniref:Uncharacterized protein n=1 Tax=Harenicola maris TaxID=2841044 RepID=A0AAP2CRH4_9RHOB|nr:hypothetical protein [Harenicola maris]